MPTSLVPSRKTFLSILLFSALITSVLCLVYADKTSPPQLSSKDFLGQDLTQAAQIIADRTVKGGAPGVVILIRKKGIDYAVSAGVANKATQQLMPIDQPLRIASITKIYTANLILNLVGQGVLNLDSPISNYLSPEVLSGLPNGPQATLRQLLMHSSGIPDYYDLTSYFTRDWQQPLTLKNTLPIAKRGKSTMQPGERYEYSNMGYILLGEIAKQTTGKPLRELFQEHVFKPLSLKQTYYNVRFPVPNGIHGYGSYFRPWADTYQWWEHSGPDGGMMASASDTAKYLEALTSATGDLKHTGQAMLQNTIPSGNRQQQGIGLMSITNKSGDTLIGHTGDVFGYQTVAFSWPEANAVFVAQINCDCGDLTTSLIKNIYLAIKADKENNASEINRPN